MKILKTLLISFMLVGLFNSCSKKSKEKSLEQKQIKIILDGGGEWKVDRFEIDGGDSTNQQLGTVGIKDYVRTFKFLPKANKDDAAWTVNVAEFIAHYRFGASDKTKIYFPDAPANCPGGTVYKPGKLHNVFLLVPHGDTEWNIEELNSEKFTLTCDYKKKYVMRLSRTSGTN